MSLVIYSKEQALIFSKIKVKTKGVNLPKLKANSVMFSIEGPDGPDKIPFLSSRYCAFKWLQHEFYGKVKNVKYLILQGEFSEPSDNYPTGRAHLQCYLQMKRGTKISAMAVYKLFALESAAQLQIIKAFSPVDAAHYCSKPHNGCDCEHCHKARKCTPNWAPWIHAGDPPTGQGKKFDRLITMIQQGSGKNTIYDQFGGLVCRYSSGINGYLNHYRERRMQDNYRCPQIELQPWMTRILFQLWLPRPPRFGIWIWSNKKNTYKTCFAVHWLAYHFRILRNIWNRKDFINMWSQKDYHLGIFNFPKNTDPYSEDYQRKLTILEDLIDGGRMDTGKYNGASIDMQGYIIITANVPPPAEWTGKDGHLKMVINTDPVEKMEVDAPAPIFGNKRKLSNPLIQPMKRMRLAHN